MAWVSFQREWRSAYSLRMVKVVVDGHTLSEIANGGMDEIEISPGEHLLQFFIGNKSVSKYGMFVPNGRDRLSVVFEVSPMGGIDAYSPNEGVLSSMNPKSGSGSSSALDHILTIAVAIIIALVVFFLLFSIKFEISFVPV